MNFLFDVNICLSSYEKAAKQERIPFPLEFRNFLNYHKKMQSGILVFVKIRKYKEKLTFSKIYTEIISAVKGFQKVLRSGETLSGNPVYLSTSSKFVSEAISMSTSSPLMFLNTANSVITIDTTPLAVMGSEHSFSNLSSISPVFLFLL